MENPVNAQGVKDAYQFIDRRLHKKLDKNASPASRFDYPKEE